MQSWLAGFCSGVCVFGLAHRIPLSQLSTHLSHLSLPALALAAGLVGFVLLARRQWLVCGLCLGVLWGAVHNHQALSRRLPDCVAGRTLDVAVRVLDDPTQLRTDAGVSVGLRFPGEITHAAENGCAELAGHRLRLSWHGAEALTQGQIWRLSIVAKPPWGYQNPGGFDYERWLLGNRLDGTGYVKKGSLLDSKFASASTLRLALDAQLEQMNLEHVGVVRALTMGDASGLTGENWRLLRATGTVHLMVISGLHVGLVAGLGFFCGRWLARLLPWALLWTPANWWGAGLSIISSGAYAAFTGGGLPAVRAFVVVAAGTIAIGLTRRWQMSTVFLLALTIILVWEPLAVHQQGFWLSFVAVGTLLSFFSHRYDRAGWLATFGLAQWCLFIGLTPAVAQTIGQVAWSGPLANLLVLPLVSFCIIPAALWGALWALIVPDIGCWGFIVADWFIGWVLSLLTWIGTYPVDHVSALDWWLVGCTCVCAWLLLNGCPWRQFAVLALLWSCFAWPTRSGIDYGEFRISGLDVGQGSAVLVDTHRHRLLFDTGPRYASGFDLGSAVVVPSLAATGPEKLDILVVSHPDMDHSGGLAAVVAAYPIEKHYSSVLSPVAHACHADTRWNWDGVDFEFHHPSARHPAARGDNDASCVLSVGNGKHTALLTGDIGEAVERGLARRLPRNIRLLFAPHHGSRNSSTLAFVRLLNPEFVFVNAGRFNSYGHPHPDVVRRYREAGARLYVTGNEGALSWESAAPMRVEAWRRDQARYWTNRIALPRRGELPADG